MTNAARTAHARWESRLRGRMRTKVVKVGIRESLPAAGWDRRPAYPGQARQPSSTASNSGRDLYFSHVKTLWFSDFFSVYVQLIYLLSSSFIHSFIQGFISDLLCTDTNQLQCSIAYHLHFPLKPHHFSAFLHPLLPWPVPPPLSSTTSDPGPKD